MIIQRQEKNYLNLIFTSDVRLKIDNQYQRTIIIQIDKNFVNKQSLSGLCGDYNHDQDDDVRLVATGLITIIPVDFGNQWKLTRNVRSC